MNSVKVPRGYKLLTKNVFNIPNKFVVICSNPKRRKWYQLWIPKYSISYLKKYKMSREEIDFLKEENDRLREEIVHFKKMLKNISNKVTTTSFLNVLQIDKVKDIVNEYVENPMVKLSTLDLLLTMKKNNKELFEEIKLLLKELRQDGEKIQK